MAINTTYLDILENSPQCRTMFKLGNLESASSTSSPRRRLDALSHTRVHKNIGFLTDSTCLPASPE